jgi:hypothetical protein
MAKFRGRPGLTKGCRANDDDNADAAAADDDVLVPQNLCKARWMPKQLKTSKNRNVHEYRATSAVIA